MSDMSGIGGGTMHEAARKMQSHVDEAEARRGSSKRPHHEPPPQDGFWKRLLQRLQNKR